MDAIIVYIVMDKNNIVMRVFTDPNLASKYIDQTEHAKYYETWATDYNYITQDGNIAPNKG